MGGRRFGVERERAVPCSLLEGRFRWPGFGALEHGWEKQEGPARTDPATYRKPLHMTYIVLGYKLGSAGEGFPVL